MPNAEMTIAQLMRNESLRWMQEAADRTIRKPQPRNKRGRDMKTKDDGGYAFPKPYSDMGSEMIFGQEGMTLRDYFAGQVIIGLISNHMFFPRNMDYNEDARAFAKMAYSFADEMLRARRIE